MKRCQKLLLAGTDLLLAVALEPLSIRWLEEQV
jgi:hypothetical protein